MQTLLPSLLILIFLFITFSFAQQQQQLQLTNNVATRSLTVLLNQSSIVAIDLPQDDATLRLEWTATDLTAFPSTLFFLSTTPDSPIRTQGNSLEHNPNAANYTCSRTQPCTTVSTIDLVSFYTRSTRAFLRLPLSPSSPSIIYVTVSNYDTGVATRTHPPPPKSLNGVLSVRLITDPAQDCPGGKLPSDPVCSDHGKCNNLRCQCNDSFNGTACERNVIRLPQTNSPPNVTFLAQPQPDSYTARVNLFSSVVFSAQHRSPREQIRLRITILRGFIPSLSDSESVQAPRLVIFDTPPALLEPLKKDVTLPTLGNRATTDDDIDVTRFTLTTPSAEEGRVIYLAFYAFPSNPDMTDGFALVSVNMTTCTVDQCNRPARDLTLELALVPAFLVTTAVAAVGVLVMLYLDRRHGITSTVDRLSEAEMERMYPKTEYSGETLECSICLCEMQLGDTVRKLHCSHTYHSECLDPWLTQNRASCPTCRTEVRVEQLSDKRHMRRIIQFFLAPIVRLRRLRDRRRGPDLIEDPPPDLEAGDTGQTLTPHPNDENNNNSNCDCGNAGTSTS